VKSLGCLSSYALPLWRDDPWIMFSVPLAAAGGFLGLWALNALITTQPLDVLTMLGFILLVQSGTRCQKSHCRMGESLRRRRLLRTWPL
jgi:hypothetical protein